MPPTFNNSATRDVITVEWSGSEPLKLPKFGERPQIALQPGRNMIRMDYFHALGGSAEMVEHIACGRLKAVCAMHQFNDGEDYCVSCHFTREMAAEERGRMAVKKKVATPPTETADESVLRAVAEAAASKP